VNKPFNAWKEGLPHYAPLLFVGFLLILLDLVTSFTLWPLGLIVLTLGIATLLFFRDPVRTVTATEGEIVAPADGAIVGIEDLDETPHYDGPCRRISIFLSVLDVHINRAPAPCTVQDMVYKQGIYKNAMKAETSEVNESNAVWLSTPYGPMTVRQISGAIARRIVCPITKGDQFDCGEKFGMIKFGSRTELYLPPGTPVCVTLKDKVAAGTTIVARTKPIEKATSGQGEV